MPDLCELRKHVRNPGRKIRAAAVAGQAILLVRRAQQPRRSLAVVRHMAGKARVLPNVGVASHSRRSYRLVRRRRMNSRRPPGQMVDLSRQNPVRIVTRQTQLPVRTIPHQKVLRDRIFRLHMRVVARRALHISLNQLHRSQRIGGLPLRNDRAGNLHRIFYRQDQAERMRVLQICPKHIRGSHRSSHAHRAIHNRLPRRHCPIMAAQAKVAVCSELQRLIAGLVIGRACVHAIGLPRKCLVPQRRRRKAGMWRVAIGAGTRPRAGDRRLAACAQIVSADHVPGHLRRQLGRSQQDERARKQEPSLHYFPPTGCFGKP